MKELDLTSCEDLDAGWDTADSSSPAPSTQHTRSSTLALADELDAGWDLAPVVETPSRPTLPLGPVDPMDRPRTSEVRELAKPARNPLRAVQPAKAPPSRTLTKKERRQLERQLRAQAAQKHAEAKAAKRQQRRQASLAVAPQPTQPVISPAPGSERKAQARPSQRNEQVKKSRELPTGVQRKSTSAQKTNATTPRTETLTTTLRPARRNALRIFGVGMLVLALIAGIWFVLRQ